MGVNNKTSLPIISFFRLFFPQVWHSSHIFSRLFWQPKGSGHRLLKHNARQLLFIRTLTLRVTAALTNRLQ